MLEWLIIGGGVHGTHLSHALTTRVGVPRSSIRVLDPHDAPMQRWHTCTQNTGMAYLRSSVVHHLALHPYALKHFAETAPTVEQPFAHPYKRPSLQLFSAHCTHVIDSHALHDLRLEGRACGLDACTGGEGYTIETDAGVLRARNVLLALGTSEHLKWPAWARELHRAGLHVEHVFAPTFDRAAWPRKGHTVVVGGGISAAQIMLSLHVAGTEQLTLLRRHSARIHQLDSDPGWIGPKYQVPFQSIEDWDTRRAVIAKSRYRGSMPPRLARRLSRLHHMGRISVWEDEVARASSTPGGGIELVGATSQKTIQADRVILATGFEAERPGGAWLSRAIASIGLSCASCGYPMVDASLQWHPGLYVTGPLAELEIGPVARNIVGARHAATRIAAAA